MYTYLSFFSLFLNKMFFLCLHYCYYYALENLLYFFLFLRQKKMEANHEKHRFPDSNPV